MLADGLFLLYELLLDDPHLQLVLSGLALEPTDGVLHLCLLLLEFLVESVFVLVLVSYLL